MEHTYLCVNKFSSPFKILKPQKDSVKPLPYFLICMYQIAYYSWRADECRLNP